MNCSLSVSLGAHIVSAVLLIEELTLRRETSIRTSKFSLDN
jgi:hypothetical protein